MATTEMVKISVHKFQPGVEAVLFSEEFEMEDDIIQKILSAKVRYMNLLMGYFEGVENAISGLIFEKAETPYEKRRTEGYKRKYRELRTAYMHILNSFSIQSYSQVTYLNRVLTMNESIRRYTEIHLEELADVEQINSTIVKKAKTEYETLLKEYLSVVRLMF